MDVVSRLVTETKRLAMEEDEQKAQVMNLKSELMAEELNLNIAQRDLKFSQLKRDSVHQSIDALHKRLGLILMFRESAKESIVLHSYLRSIIRDIEPSEEQMIERMNSYRGKYHQVLEKYETLPSYKAILEEEAAERDLAGIIIEMRNQLMRLETEQEF